MIDEGLLPIANTRFILMENPADQTQLPPAPPASESESATMWRPADQTNGDVERIPLANEGEREAAAAYGIWLGASLIHTVIADAKNGKREEPQLPDHNDGVLDARSRKKK